MFVCCLLSESKCNEIWDVSPFTVASVCASSVTKWWLSLCDPTTVSAPGSSVHGISSARILVWVAISFSRGSAWPRDPAFISCIGRWVLYHWATRKPAVALRKQQIQPSALAVTWSQDFGGGWSAVFPDLSLIFSFCIVLCLKIQGVFGK